MPETTPGYANWKAPAEDGKTVLWPSPSTLIADTRSNHAALSTSFQVSIQNVPLPELRRQMRQWIGHAEQDQPLVMSGHQTELYHAGVWVKIALMHALAPKLGAATYHLAVDTDQPKHLNLRWPGEAVPISDDPRLLTAEWSGQLQPPSPAHVRMLQEHLARAFERWGYQPMLSGVLGSLRRSAVESVNLPSAITGLQHEIDWDLQLQHEALLVSPLLETDPYLAFAHHILSRPAEFAGHYNAAIDDYRREAGIKSATRPMPNLRVSDTSIEVPFWRDDLGTGARTRAEVRRVNDGWAMVAGDDFFHLVPTIDAWTAAHELRNWLRQHRLRLASRALTFTLFVRLLMADQFIHGIGGGRYDQITDRIIRQHFGLEPPRFAVTTATMYFPAALSRKRVCLNCLSHDGHRLRHSLLGDGKQHWLKQIAELPRRTTARSLAFHQMHDALSVAASGSPALVEWKGQYHEAELRDKDDEVIFDRELFYALQPRDRLEQMIARYNAAMK